MDLHRIEGKPEWDTVAAEERNSWQRVAASTHGIVTAGNALTLLGFAIAAAGLVALLQERYWLALAGIVIGRLFDIADGVAADKTGTKSPFGELLDASFDKLIVALTLLAFFVGDVAPWGVLVLLLLPQLALAILSFIQYWWGKPLHPSRSGKIGMALAWVGLVGLLVLRATDMTSLNLLSVLVYVCIFASVGFGCATLIEYLGGKSKAA
jgi:phosphatidylglycerophosphate synthase